MEWMKKVWSIYTTEYYSAEGGVRERERKGKRENGRKEIMKFAGKQI